MSDHAASPVRLALHTEDGLALQAELAVPAGPARAAVVVAHPHPLHGGNMHATVVDALFRALPSDGVAILRFNFRGVQGSQGRHGYGRDECLDVAAAADEMAERFGDVPLVLAGWSFGADVSLAVDHPRVTGWVAVAPPLRILAADELIAGRTGRPVLLVVPAHDQFCPPDEVRSRTAAWDATVVEVIPMADHFLTGHLGKVVDLTRQFVLGLASG